jgi:Tfp pilus assembly protein PilF
VEPLFRRLGDRPWLARVVNNQGVFLTALGRRVEAAHAYEEAAELHLIIADRALAASSLLNWAELMLDHGQVAEAQMRLERAQELLSALLSPPAWVVRTCEALTRRFAEATQPG